MFSEQQLTQVQTLVSKFEAFTAASCVMNQALASRNGALT